MFLLLFLAIFLPGLSIAVLVARKEQMLMLAMPLSLALYTGITAILFKADNTQWVFPLYFVIGALLVLWVGVSYKHRITAFTAIRCHWPVFALMAAFALYQFIVGPFTDFGVDLYRHLGFTNKALRGMEDQAGAMQINLNPGTLNLVFHHIAAYFMYATDMNQEQLVHAMMLSYSLLWTLGVYLFCHAVFAMLAVPQNRLVWLSILSVLLYWLTFGINNFSFPRYYIGGPVILSYAVYMAVLVLVFEMLRTELTVGQLLLAGILTATMTFLHPQELLLLVSNIMSICIVLLTGFIGRTTGFQDLPANTRNAALSLLGLCTIAIVVVAIIYLKPKYAHDPISLLNLGVLHQRFGAWNILRPDHQFFTVLGWWGLLVLLSALVFYRYTLKNAIATSLVILPFITVFNPLYAEAVMKLAYPAVLWRQLFALHLPVVACYLIWMIFSGWQVTTLAGKVAGITAVVLLTLLLFPFKTRIVNNELVKLPSLTSTPTANSWENWGELIEALNAESERRSILSDPATGYAIRSMTSHFHYGQKFFPKRPYRQMNFESYVDHPLGQYKGWLLVINLKNGDINRRLRPPHHIYPNVMKVDHHYSQPLLDEVFGNTERYQLKWQGEKQFIYEIL